MTREPVPIAAKVAMLRRPRSYPGPPRAVEAIETHMSWVFLADDHVYKLKKPVRYDYLDFSTVAARRRYCVEEVRLNRRLAGSVYLDAVPLTLDAQGILRLDGSGTAVDWLVKMRRLPTERMLDWALAHGTACAEDARAVATRLSEFYLALPPVALSADGYRDRLRVDIDQCRRELGNPAFGLPAAQVRRLGLALHRVLERNAGLFDRRVHEGRIVEGHGDLRPEHVCLDPPIAIIDCLEFSLELRTLDTVDELGFLALECERLGNPGFGGVLVETYRAIAGDRPDAALLHFYQGYRACVRAKLAVWHLREEDYRDGGSRWSDSGRRYLQLAQRHMRRCEQALRDGAVSSRAVR